jgi:hypothetical protein
LAFYKPDPTQTNPTKPNPTQPNQTQLNPTHPNPIQPNQTEPNITKPNLTYPNLAFDEVINLKFFDQLSTLDEVMSNPHLISQIITVQRDQFSLKL